MVHFEQNLCLLNTFKQERNHHGFPMKEVKVKTSVELE